RRSGGTLVWRHTPGARAYAVYRVNGKADACAFADARNLVAIVPASRNPRLAVKGDGKYYVSALDRLSNESAAVLARCAAGPEGSGGPGVGEQVPGVAQELREDLGPPHHRHEVRVTAPPGHDVLVQVGG